jgi:N-acetylneuraminic acid mutarotase
MKVYTRKNQPRRGIRIVIAAYAFFSLSGAALPLQGQTESAAEPLVTHNTWTSGAAMPTGVSDGAAAVLKNEIYVIGGNDASGYANSGIVADTQIYNPATNDWSSGASYPTAIEDASAAVVKNILYVFGGTSDGSTGSNAVWAYNPKTKTWSSKAAMPTARCNAAATVENNIIYVIGGSNGNNYLATVESYNPATDSWTEEAPLLSSKANLAAGLIGTTIVAADGAIAPGQITGDTEGYDAATNTWSELTADPTARFAPCYGSVGSKFYVAGGYAASTLTEAFQLTKNKWTTLAAMPQGTMLGSSAVYKGQLYCLGGWATWEGSPVSNVQIYQP